MKIKIAVLGPKDSVDRIIEIGKEFDKHVEYKAYSYSVKDEVGALSEHAAKEADVLLFSGEASYKKARQSNELNKPGYYVPRTSTCFYRSLWEMRDLGIVPGRISSDVILDDTPIEDFDELNVGIDQVYDIKKSFENSYEELVAFHYNRWIDGEIDAAVTGYEKVYELLRDKDVPVFRLYPTKFLIRETIYKALLSGRTRKIKESQIAVQIVAFRVRGEVSSSGYEYMRLKNQLEKILIDYTASRLGSMFVLNRDEYMIFTNRGSVESVYSIINLHSKMHLEGDDKIIISSGIGFGNTVYEAEKNARSSLEQSIKKTHDCVYITDDNGNMAGPFSKTDEMARVYDFDTDINGDINLIAENTSLNPVYISKIRAMLKKANRDTVDANIVSDMLGISVRSARRILSVLVEYDYAIISDKESSLGTGRPRKIYEIKF